MAYLREASKSYFKITKGYALKWLINVFSNNQILKCLRNVYYHKILKEYGKAFGIFCSNEKNVDGIHVINHKHQTFELI